MAERDVKMKIKDLGSDDGSNAEEEEREEEGLYVMPWLGALLEKLSVTFWETVALDCPLSHGELFAGTGAATRSLFDILGESNIRPVWCVDCARRSKAFVLSNLSPEHWYGNVDDLLQSKPAHCGVCNGPCSVKDTEELDIVTAGFPCQPFSPQNHHRFSYLIIIINKLLRFLL